MSSVSCTKLFELWNLIKICVRTRFFGKQNSTLGSVVPLSICAPIMCVYDNSDIGYVGYIVDIGKVFRCEGKFCLFVPRATN